MHRPGVELAIFRSRVRLPNHYTTDLLVEKCDNAFYNVENIIGTLTDRETEKMVVQHRPKPTNTLTLAIGKIILLTKFLFIARQSLH